MRVKQRTIACVILTIITGLFACNPVQETPSTELSDPSKISNPTPTRPVVTAVPTTAEPSPSATITQTPTLPPPSHTPTPVPLPADIIFYHGNIITMEESQPLIQALAIRKGIIQAAGSDEEILEYQGEKTRVIDLKKNTIMPGFIDGHTHILTFHDRMGYTLAQAQDTALRFGYTGVTEMWTNEDTLNALLEAESQQDLRLRVNVFPSYNDGVLDENRRRILFENWYPDHDPILDPDSQVVSSAQQAGYRVAFHAMGDLAIETTLNAIEFALDGQPNANVRHQIQHNSLIRDDLLVRYEALDIAASVRGYGGVWCDLQSLIRPFGEERYLWYVNRYALPNLPIHSYIESDFGWHVDPDDRFAIRTLDPIVHLYGMVSHNFIMPDGSICGPDPISTSYQISIERVLEMLTIEPAYAVSMADYIGSLRTGKYADLIILSANPLEIDPMDLRDLQVWMTMVAGEVEYCASGREILCPGAQAPVDLATSGNLALDQRVTASNSQQFPAQLAVDGDDSTSWGAGDFAPQWIEIDLGAPATVTDIRMRVAQSPKGETLHRILVGTKPGTLSEIHRFQQVTRDGEWLVFHLLDPMEDIQIVRVETISSPSWVAWFEIEVEGYR